MYKVFCTFHLPILSLVENFSTTIYLYMYVYVRARQVDTRVFRNASISIN